MPTVAAAFVPTFISFDDDDDFGEFEFAAVPASTSSSSPPVPPPHRATSNQQQWQKPAGDEDDGWGNFVDSPLQPQLFSTPNPPPAAPPSSPFFDPFPVAPAAAPDPAPVCPALPVAGDRGWQKPTGALPLSLFGEEDEEDGGGEESTNSTDGQISDIRVGTFPSFRSGGSNGVVSAQGEGLKDLIASLYGQASKAGPATAGNSDGDGDNLKFHRGNGAKSDSANGGDDDEDEFSESCWEFKDALSSTPAGGSSDCVLVEKGGELVGVPGAEAKASDTASGFQTSSNYNLKPNGQKCENMLGSNLPSRVLNDEGDWGNAFVSHDATVNGFDFRSVDNGCNGSISNAHHDSEHVNIENDLNPNVVNGDVSLDDSFWEFKDASSNIKTMNHSTEPEKEAELAGVPGVEAKATDTGSGFQTSGNYTKKSNGQKCETMLGSNLPSRVLSDEGEWGSAFLSHDTTVNGFETRSADNVCNGSISNAHHDFEHVNIENGLNPNGFNGDMSLDDSFWEFKDASSNTKTMNHSTRPESTRQVGFDELENLHVSDCCNGNKGFGDSFLIIEGCQYGPNSIVDGSEDVKDHSVVGLNELVLNMYNDSCKMSAVSSKQSPHSWHNSELLNETLKDVGNVDSKYAGLETEKVQDKSLHENMDNLDISAEPAKFVDFYSRLKQRSCTLVLHHSDNLKKANGEDIPIEEPKAVYSDDEIKAVCSKLGIAAFESDHIEKCPPNEFAASELLQLLQKPCFQALDMEYSLSEKIPLAEKDLSSAMWLFEHASHILRILTLASYEEQRIYILSWSKMVSVCEMELQHGAVIWSQACRANIQKELLSESRGQKYFLALGEIYRVVEILSASIRVYKAWILLNPADSRVFLTCIKNSLEVWKASTLKQALEVISESFGEQKVVTELLESIKSISGLGAHTLQSHFSNQEAHFCRLSLLPFEMLPDIKQVVWHGDHFFSKLANLWANRISHDAPQLPHVHVGQ